MRRIYRSRYRPYIFLSMFIISNSLVKKHTLLKLKVSWADNCDNTKETSDRSNLDQDFLNTTIIDHKNQNLNLGRSIYI